MRLLIFVIYFFLIAFQTLPVWAHGVEGKRFFVESIVTEAATVNPDLGFGLSHIKDRHGEELELGIGLALRLTHNLGIEIEGEWVSIEEEEEEKRRGILNPELVLKYVVGRSELHEWIGTVAIEIEPPYGSKEVGSEDSYEFGVGFLYGKGFGDLPENLSYLRPLMIQGDLLFHPDSRSRYALALSYSFPYLQQFVKDVGLLRPLNRLFPMVELTYEREEGETTGIARPGFYWVGRNVQIALAAMVSISSEAREKDMRGVVGTLTLYLDDLFPEKMGKPAPSWKWKSGFPMNS